MKTQILVYVGNGESADFECGRRSIDEVQHPTSKKAQNKVYGLYGDQYRVKNDLVNGFCFFVIMEEYTNAKKEDVKCGIALSEEHLKTALRKYLNVIRSVIFDYLCENDYGGSSVYVITHWGGGTPAEIDKTEKTLSLALREISSMDKCFTQWSLLSASETMRPKLFTDRFSTVVARKNGTKAELPDAEECEKILERHKRKEYGNGCVDWCERDPKRLYNDIMEHLNH